MVNYIRLFVKYLNSCVLACVFLITQVSASIIETKPSNQTVVKIAVTDIPYSLSPYAAQSLESQYSHLFFDPLVRWGRDGNLEYRLLAKLKKLNNDKTRFYLKKNIHFHSGNQLTSRDVIWSLKAAKENKYQQRKIQKIVKIIRINDYQFDIQSKLTQSQLLDYLSHFFILDSAYYKKNKIDHNAAQIALSPPITTLPISGTGPYRVASFYAGVNLRVDANPTYWQNKPMFTSLNFVKIKSIDSRLYALLAGDVDISEAIANKNINSVHLLEDKKIVQTATFNALFLMINEQKNDLFERRTARNAIHLAINQSGMLRHILNGTGSFNSTLQVSEYINEEPTYDAKRAKYLLKKMNAPKRMSLLVMVDSVAHTQEVSVALTNMLKKVGIVLDITEVSSIDEWNKLQFNHDLSLSNWQSPLIDSSNIYQDILNNSLLSGYLSYLFETEKKALTMQDKIALFKEFQREDKIVPLVSQNKIWATDKQFDLESVFSANAIAYWHLLTVSH